MLHSVEIQTYPATQILRFMTFLYTDHITKPPICLFQKMAVLGHSKFKIDLWKKNCEANNIKCLHCVSNTFDCIVTILQWRNAMQWGLFHAQMPIRIFWGGLQSFSVWGGIISFVRWHYFSAWKADFSLKSDVQKKKSELVKSRGGSS